MYNSLKKIVNFAKKKDVKIAIETQGSSKKNNFLLMQRPEEYQKLFQFFTPSELGVSLNIGHLNLASKAFNFSKLKFIEKLKPYIVAFELSHNNGKEDQHLPLKKMIRVTTYWRFLNSARGGKLIDTFLMISSVGFLSWAADPPPDLVIITF